VTPPAHRSGPAHERFVALCAEVTTELDRLVPGIVAEIRRQIPEYDPVDLAEHQAGVKEQYLGLLRGLSEGRPPNGEELARARALGQRRAEEGLTLQAVMSAYHIGYRAIWNAILKRSTGRAGSSSAELLGQVELVWTWVQGASSAAAQAYEQAARLEGAARTTLLLRLLNGIYSGAARHADLESTARALGYDPARDFRVLVSPAESWEPLGIGGFRRQLTRMSRSGVAHVETRGTSFVTISQGMPADALIAMLQGHSSDLAVGVGLERTGLAGAGESAAEAEDTLAFARTMSTNRVVWFERDWLSVTLFQREARLAPLLEPARGAATLHSDAAMAVRGFIDHGFSFSATGRALHLHPNTIRYRIERWEQLTGWDLKTAQGLSRSIAALGLARRHGG